jgi:hypothetical protein
MLAGFEKVRAFVCCPVAHFYCFVAVSKFFPESFGVFEDWNHNIFANIVEVLNIFDAIDVSEKFVFGVVD